MSADEAARIREAVEAHASAAIDTALAAGARDVDAALELSVSTLLVAALRRSAEPTRHLLTIAHLLGELICIQDADLQEGLLRVLKQALNEGAGRTAAPVGVAVH